MVVVTKILVKDRKKARMIFITLLVFSAIILLLSSEDEVFWFIKPGSRLERILCVEVLKNSILYNLSLGMIVSSIFYYFVSYIPEERRRERLKPLLKHKIQRVVSIGESFLKDYYNVSEEGLKNLTEERIIIPQARTDFEDEIRSAMERNPSEDRSQRGGGIRTSVTIEGKIYCETLGTSLANIWFLGLKEYRDLEEYSQAYEDIELTKLMHEANIMVEMNNRFARNHATNNNYNSDPN